MSARSPLEGIEGRVRQIARWLSELYALDVELDVARFVIDPELARSHAPLNAPRTGVLVVEEPDLVWLGLYVDSRDRGDLGTLVEETSHLLCLAQHARWELPVSRLALELQAEVDRYVHARQHGGDPFRHFQRFHWAPGLPPEARDRYRAAQHRGERYCRGLARRFPRQGDTPGLYRELRHFYRVSPLSKLAIAAA